MADPFNLDQYITSFTAGDSYTPHAFAFADFPNIFAMLSEQIRMRQAAIRIGFLVPDTSFVNIEHYDLTTPSSVAGAVVLFQNAIEQMIDTRSGSILDTYAKLSHCNNVYTGFFVYPSNGYPILGLVALLQQNSWTAPPDPAVVTNRLDFARDIGANLNEIIKALNVLVFIHGPMVTTYPLDTTCSP